VPKIAPKSVAEIDRRTKTLAKYCRDIACNLHAWREIKMPTEACRAIPRATDRTGDIYAISNARVSTRRDRTSSIDAGREDRDTRDDRVAL
jgi:hypothetical protein